MRPKRRGLATSCVVMLAAHGLAASQAQQPDLSRHSIDGGGIMRSTGGSLELSGTIGQPDAGVMTGGSLQLTGGFWFPLAIGDCDSDGGVSLFDHADAAPCLEGPTTAAPRACTCFDIDGDRDIDLADAAAFQIAFTGQ